MKEARIVMPCASSIDGWGDIHNRLTRDLCHHFGGCTKTLGSGNWVVPNGKIISETVLIYDVAIIDSDENVDRLCQIAEHYGRTLKQHSIYVRYPDGRVFITELK